MPLIELTVPAGALTEEGRAGIQRELAGTLLRWEGAPDKETFRSVAWSYVHELPPGAQVTAQDDAPRFRVDIRIPAGALSDRRKAGVVQEMTQVVLKAAGLEQGDAGRVWVLIHEQADGTWGAGGRIVRHEDLVALARSSSAADGA